MSERKIGISWTDEAMNSLYGCTECSKGCGHCYARQNIYRFSRNGVLNRDKRFSRLIETSTKLVVNDGVREEKEVQRFTGRLLFNPAKLYACLKSKPGSLIFVDEFSDLLHRVVPMDVILEHFRVFRYAHWLQFQILTKRSGRLEALDGAIKKEFGEWPANVWIGVSVCTPQKGELKKVAALGKTEARIKWVSFEPWLSGPENALEEVCPNLAGLLRDNDIAWSVIGGESGSKKEARLMTFEDAQYLFKSSKSAGCSVHFKQLGTKLAIDRGVYGIGDHRSKGGNPDQIPPSLMERAWPEPCWQANCDVEFEPRFDLNQVIEFE